MHGPRSLWAGLFGITVMGSLRESPINLCTRRLIEPQNPIRKRSFYKAAVFGRGKSGGGNRSTWQKIEALDSPFVDLFRLALFDGDAGTDLPECWSGTASVRLRLARAVDDADVDVTSGGGYFSVRGPVRSRSLLLQWRRNISKHSCKTNSKHCF